MTVHAAIATRFCAPEWATFFEVGDAAGFGKSRSADAVAMNTWPSRGLAIHGFEVKVSRTDFLRELKNPAKSAPIQRFCDFWWVCVSDDVIAKPAEMPEAWGLMVLRGKKLVVAKEAPKLQPEAFTRSFAACLLRRATESVVPKATLNELVEQRVEERLDQHQRRNRDYHADEARRHKMLFDELQKNVAVFEEASGVKVREYNRPSFKIGQAVRFVLDGGLRPELRAIENARGLIEHAAETLKAVDEAARALVVKDGAA